jgi:class 3 adenylate cyclase
MFADMVGFTALMQRAEKEARALRDRYRAVLMSAVERHAGRVVQHYGDGALCMFGSAVHGVRCAVEMQEELRGEPKVLVRVGLHTGDIVVDAEGAYGDGVNVASRIEALAAPGGVMISGKVFDEIKNQPAIRAVPFGAVRLKNVARPTRLFAISSRASAGAGGLGSAGLRSSGSRPWSG